MIALLVITDGRPYLADTVASLRAHVPHSWHRVVLVDDSGDQAHTDTAADLVGADHVVTTNRTGGAAAIRAGWSTITELGDITHVFHLEDDWTFTRDIDVEAMRATLDAHPKMANLVLRRQPWGTEGPGGYIGDNPAAFWPGDGFLAHTLGFWLNPCLYGVDVCEVGWPAHGHEHDMTARLPGRWFGVAGGVDDPPAVTHIGDRRSPSWTW